MITIIFNVIIAIIIIIVICKLQLNFDLKIIFFVRFCEVKFISVEESNFFAQYPGQNIAMNFLKTFILHVYCRMKEKTY